VRETRVTIPELMLIAGTRAALGAGLGLLLADQLPPGQRRAVGWTLLLIGALSTVPLAVEIFGHTLPDAHNWGPDWDTGQTRHRPGMGAIPSGV
jgi:hypothetical protein